MQVVSDSLNNFTQATLNNFLGSKCLNYAMKLKKSAAQSVQLRKTPTAPQISNQS